MVTPRYMGDSRHPRPYRKGIRKQMTIAWKQRVLDRLAENERNDVAPRSLAELARMLRADKRGIYVTFDLGAKKPQTASVYVDAICQILNIDPPMQETPQTDDELEQEMNELRKLPVERQREWVSVIRSIRIARSE